MPLEPTLQPILARVQAALKIPSVEEGRAALNERNGLLASYVEPPPTVAWRDYHLAVPQGTITARAYSPDGDPPYAAHLYFHTGGFWSGDLSTSDTWCRELCAGTGAVVFSVDYRLAPEHRYPVAREDSYAALCWIAEHAADLGIDPQRISVGGASSGGNLAAVTTLMARDRQGPSLIFQLLELPTTDFTLRVGEHPSLRENGQDYMLTFRALQIIRNFYLADPERQAAEPYASPLLAPDLSGLPPALIMTAEYDPLRDEGEAYGRRLRDAGVPAEVKRWTGIFHGAEHLTLLLPLARDYRATAIQALRQAYGADGPARHRAASDAGSEHPREPSRHPESGGH